jgi:hypothetical protein
LSFSASPNWRNERQQALLPAEGCAFLFCSAPRKCAAAFHVASEAMFAREPDDPGCEYRFKIFLGNTIDK